MAHAERRERVDQRVDDRRRDPDVAGFTEAFDAEEIARRRRVRVVDLGVRKIDLLTNNPRKVVGLEAYGLHIESRVPVQVAPNPHNRRYLSTKRDKLGHLLDLLIGET